MDFKSTRHEVARLVRAATREPGTSFPGGADDVEIADLQREVGLKLPPELVEWLRMCKGDVIGPGYLYGVRYSGRVTDIASVLERFPRWRERGWLPVAGDGSGDYYVLIARGDLIGYVAFVDQSDLEILDYVVASNLWAFVRFLLTASAGDRRWPFDRDYVLGLDPGMADVPTGLQPWSTGSAPA
jgi:cell wall assembly regulator SMI1